MWHTRGVGALGVMNRTRATGNDAWDRYGLSRVGLGRALRQGVLLAWTQVRWVWKPRKRARSQSAPPQMQAPVGADGDEGDLLERFRAWLRESSRQPHLVEAAVDMAAPVRRFLPSQTGQRRLIAAVFCEVFRSALGGNEAAEAMMVALPRILMRRKMHPRVALRLLIRGELRPVEVDQCGVARRNELFALRSLSAATEEGNAAAVLRRLDGLARSRPDFTREDVEKARAKFPQNVVHECPRGDVRYAEENRLHPETADEQCVTLSAADVRRWAFSRRHKAPDLYGWSGQILADVFSVEAGAANLAAQAFGRHPAKWRLEATGSAWWREARGQLIPKVGEVGSFRPIAIASVPRRIWAAKSVRILRPAAAKFAEKAGQFGASAGMAPAIVYAAVARWALSAGGSICTQDVENSFGTMGRRHIVEAGAALARAPHVQGTKVARVIAAVYTRCFLGEPHADSESTVWNHRVVHNYGRIPVEHVNHGLIQGSPESSVLEAITYAHAAAQRDEGKMREGAAAGAGCARALTAPFRLGFHDDGYTVAGPGMDSEAFDREPHFAGAKWAVHKTRVAGPLAGRLVASGFAKEFEGEPAVFGIPVGRHPEKWVGATFGSRVKGRIATLRRVAKMPGGRHIAASCAMLSGGPASMGRHWMMATAPSPMIDEALCPLDVAWVDLWLELAGVREDQPAMRAAVEQRIYAPAPDGFGHQRCNVAHRAAHAAGLVVALPKLRETIGLHNLRSFGRAEVHPDDVAAAAGALGAPIAAAESSGSVSALDLTVRLAARASAALDAVIQGEEEAADKARELLAANQFGACSRDKRTKAIAEGERYIGVNLLVEALRHVPEVARGDEPISDDRCGILLRRVFGLPLGRDSDSWPRSYGPLPAGCPLCQAESDKSFGTMVVGLGEQAQEGHEGAPRRVRKARRVPRTVFDDRGDHKLVCKYVGKDVFERHQVLARAVAVVGRQAGLLASVEPKSFRDITGHASNLRPADVTLCRADGSKVVAVDVTVVHGLNSGAEIAEREKALKYGELEKQTGRRVVPFAITSRGQGGPAARGLCEELAQRVKVGQSGAMSQQAAWRYVMGRISLAFANAVSMVIEQFDRRVEYQKHGGPRKGIPHRPGRAAVGRKPAQQRSREAVVVVVDDSDREPE